MFDDVEKQIILDVDDKIQEDLKKAGLSYSGREECLIMFSRNATGESRQLDLIPSKNYCPLSVGDKRVHQKELDFTELDKDTNKVIVREKSVLVSGTKKNQLNEATMTFDIPDQCDLDRVEAGFHSDNVLYIRYFSRNEPDVKV